jgi:hypothetical protein
MTDFNKLLQDSGYLDIDKPVDDRSEFRKGATSALMNTVAGGKALLGAANSNPQMQYEALQDMQQTGYENQAKVGTIEDIGGVGEFTDWLSYNMGSGTASIATMVAGGGVGGLIGKQAIKYGGTQALKGALQATGATAAGFTPNYGESLNNVYQETGEIKNIAAFTAAGIKTSLDMFTPLRVLKASGKAKLADNITEKVKMRLVNDNRFKSAMIEVGKTSGIEAVTEATQSYVDQVALNILTENKSMFAVRDWSELMNSAAAGAAGSLGFGAYGGYQKSNEAQALRQQSQQQNINADELLNSGPSVEQTLNSGQDVDLTAGNAQPAQGQQPNYDNPTVARNAGVDAQGGSALFGFSDGFINNAPMRQGNKNAQANPMVPVDQAQTWQPNFSMNDPQMGMTTPNIQANGVAPYTYEGELIQNRQYPNSVPVGQTLNSPFIEGEFEQQRALPDRTNVIYGQDGRAQQQSDERFAGIQQELGEQNSNLLPQKDIIFGEDQRPLQLNSQGKPFKSEAAVKLNKNYRAAVDNGVKPRIVPVNGGYAWENENAPAEVASNQQQEVAPTSELNLPTENVSGRTASPAMGNSQNNTGPTKVTTPKGRDIDVEYQVMEADQLIASNDDSGKRNPNYPQQLQPRDRSRGASEMQIKSISNNLKPQLLAENPLTSDGAPIVSQQGVVESGNGRTLAIRRAYKEEKASEYRAYLESKGYNTTGMKQPVLVRVRQTQMSDQELQEYTKESNERSTLAMSSSEQAKSDANLIDPIIDDYVGGDLVSSVNRSFVRKFMKGVSGADQASMMSEDGTLSQEGQKRIQAAIVSKAYGDDKLTSEMFENTDSDMKSIGGALLDIAGSWSKMRGKVSSELDVTPDLVSAVNKVRQARAEGRSIKELVNQDDMFSGETNQKVSALINVFYTDSGKARSRKAVTQALTKYADIASNTQTGESLFGDELEQANVLDILEQANEENKRSEKQGQGQQGLFGESQDPSGSNKVLGERTGQQKPQAPKREDSQDVNTAANEAATSPLNKLREPTEGQKEAGNYKKGKLSIQGLNISIENPKGSKRTGIDSDGKPWSTTMKHHYGDIKGTVGADGDSIDTFVGEAVNSKKVFVVDQNDVVTGDFDEHKVMLGFITKEQARKAYLANYNKGFSGFGEITETTMPEFKEWIKKPRKSKQPFSNNSNPTPPKPPTPPKSKLNSAASTLKDKKTKAAADLAALLKSKKGQLNSGFDPEVMIAIAKVGGYTVAEGTVKFAQWVRDVLGFTRSAGINDADVSPYLKEAYGAISYNPEKYEVSEELADTMDPPRVVAKTDIAALTSETTNDVSTTSERVEQDGESANQEPQSANVNENESIGSEQSTGSTEQATDANIRSDSKPSVSTNDGAMLGEGSISDLFDTEGAIRPNSKPSNTGNGGRGSGNNDTRTQAKPETTPATDSAVERLKPKESEAQTKQNKTHKAKIGDKDDILKSVPVLMDEQASDIAIIEERFFGTENPGLGYQNTNGTGTGKTFVGLGAAKRFAQMGKDNILIVVPNDGIAQQWVAAGKDFFGMDIYLIGDKAKVKSKDPGKGITISTYATLGKNNALINEREAFDLIIADESQNLMGNQQSKDTNALKQFRALTNHEDGRYHRAVAAFSDEQSALNDKIQVMKRKLLPTTDIVAQAERDAKDYYKDEQREISDKVRALSDELSKQGQFDTKALFLSATPWPYVKNLAYAEGFLFNYTDYGDKFEGGYDNGFNGQNAFYIKNFGYRWRYHKLNSPGAEVDQSLMELTFHENLKEKGVMGGRVLEVEADYKRDFIKVETAAGEKFDEMMELFGSHEQEVDDSEFPDHPYRELGEIMRKKFDYHSRIKLTEAIKAEEAVERAKDHIKMGRKVVIFHSYNVGGSIDPVEMVRYENPSLLAAFEADYPGATNINFGNLARPLDLFQDEFGDAVRFYNGNVKDKDRLEAKTLFNDDNSEVKVIVVQQDAGEAGISLHDVTGKHQRVLINIGMPVKPTQFIQIEGRTYRVGVKTDAQFENLTTGTAFERHIFASTIAGRASTAENLAMGEFARSLKENISEGYLDASYQPAQTKIGVGGKVSDRPTKIDDWDRAKSYYYSNMKRNQKTKSAEGADYFATPEPVGLKMVQWAQVKPGDRLLEPSVGHAAIGRWFPGTTRNKAVEQSFKLSSLAQMTFAGEVINDSFESLNLINKFEAVIMNPPFGKGGKLAYEHVRKALKHLVNGGRVVALVPDGPAANKNLNKMLEDPKLQNIYQAAEVDLPQGVFERAGTGVKTKIVIFDRFDDEADAPQMQNVSFTGAKDINELFDRVKDVELRQRNTPTLKEVDPTQYMDTTKKGTASGYPVSFYATLPKQVADIVNQEAENQFGAKPSRDNKKWVFDSEEERTDFANSAARIIDEALESGVNITFSAPANAVRVDGEKSNDYFEYSGETYTTKKGKEFLVTEMVERQEYDAYKQLKELAKDYGGWARGQNFMFPSEDDITQFNAKAKELLEGEKTDSVMFNRSEERVIKGVPLADAELVTASFIDFYSGLDDNMDLVITDKKPSELFNNAQLEPGDDTAIKGGFDKNANRLYIFSQNHSSIEDVRRTLREELLVHKGLGLFSQEQVTELVTAIGNTRSSINKKVKAIWANIDKNYAKAPPLVQAEEFLGKVAQEKPSDFGRLWNELVAAMTKLLRKAGLVKPGITLSEMKVVVYEIGDKLRTGNRSNAVSSVIPDTIKVNGITRSTRDSAGSLISNTVEGIENFWKWRTNGESRLLAGKGQGNNATGARRPNLSNDGFYFSGSWKNGSDNARVRRLRDSAINDGSTRFYHGTKQDIAEFDINSKNKKDFGWLGKGVYISPFTSIAQNYANIKKGDNGPNVIPLYAKINNPIMADETLKYSLMNKSEAAIGKWTLEQIAKGFDSVIMTLDGSEIAEVVIFDPNQLKSAIGNNGDYSTESNDIRLNRTGSPDIKIKKFQNVKVERIDDFSSLLEDSGSIDKAISEYYNDEIETVKSMFYDVISKNDEAVQSIKEKVDLLEYQGFTVPKIIKARLSTWYTKSDINKNIYTTPKLSIVKNDTPLSDPNNIASRLTQSEKMEVNYQQGILRSNATVFEKKAAQTAIDKITDKATAANDIRFNRVMSSAKEKLGLGDQEPASIVDNVKSLLDNATVDKIKEGWSNWRERATEGVFDSLYGIKKAEEAAGIDIEKQGYVSARLASGVSDVIHAVMFHGAPKWSDGIVQKKEGTKGLLEVFGQLDEPQLNDWLAWMAGNRANKLMEEGRENNLTQSEIDELIQLNAGREGLFNRIKDEYNQINTATLDLAQEAGLVSPEIRNNFESEYYVPFFRDVENEDNDIVGALFSNKGISNQNANLKKLKGGKQKTKDILENILLRQAKMIEASMKNKAMLEVAENLQDTGAMNAVKLNMIEIQQVYKNKGKTPYVSVMSGGEKVWYQVNEPALLRGLTQLNLVRDDNPWIKMGRAAKRFLTVGVTMSPEFIFRNFIRDSAHGWMINKDKFKFGIDSVKGAAKTWNKDKTTLDMMFAGASFQGGYVHATDPEASAQLIRRALRKKGLSKSQINDYLASIPKNLSATLEKYREFSDGMENANRASTYDASLKAGKSKKISAFEAKDFMDFSLQGNYRTMQTLVDLIPFLNARLQGMYKLKRASINEGDNAFIKRFSKELATKGMMVAGFSLALAALNSEEERYKDLQDWDKDANWHFFFGDTHIRIPKPFELGIIFGTMPERMFHLSSGDQSSKDIGKSAVHAIVSTMSFNPIPQFVKPALEAYTNYDIFGGRDIDSFGDMRKRPEDRYSMYTTGTAKNLGDLLGWSPKRIDHLIRGYGGTLASYVLAMADGIASGAAAATSKDEFKYNEFDDLSLVRAFVQNDEVGSSYFRQEYYDMLKEVNAVYGQYKIANEEQDLETAQEIMKNGAIQLKFRPMFNKVQAQMNKLNNKTNLTWRNESIPLSQREKILDDLSRQKNALAKRIILLYREYGD